MNLFRGVDPGRQNQVGPQCHKGFGIELPPGAADARHGDRLLRVVGEIVATDNLPARTDGEENLGIGWRQGDDTLWRTRQRHRPLQAIDDGQFPCGSGRLPSRLWSGRQHAGSFCGLDGGCAYDRSTPA